MVAVDGRRSCPARSLLRWAVKALPYGFATAALLLADRLADAPRVPVFLNDVVANRLQAGAARAFWSSTDAFDQRPTGPLAQWAADAALVAGAIARGGLRLRAGLIAGDALVLAPGRRSSVDRLSGTVVVRRRDRGAALTGVDVLPAP